MKDSAELRLLKTLRTAMADAYEVGGIDKKTMRRFDKACREPLIDATPEAIRSVRDEQELSQARLAWHLNVTPGLVSKWERGEKRPGGPALKLLSLIKHKGLDAISL